MTKNLIYMCMATLVLTSGCEQEADKTVVGDPCEAESDCASTVCHRGLCVRAAPADIGEGCRVNAECKSFFCVTGQCGWGNLLTGRACRFSEECADRWCLSGKCKDAPRDGGVPDSAPPDMRPPDQGGPDLPVPDLPAPDLPAPDLPAPDLPIPEQLLPDQRIPDHLIPDQELPDQMLPDLLIPDLLPPDVFPPGGCIPSTTRKCFTGTSGCTKSGTSYSCKGLCKAGTQTCQATYTWPAATVCTGETKPVKETCDTFDQDCDGTPDNGVCYSSWSGVSLKVEMNVMDAAIEGKVILLGGRLKSTSSGGIQRSQDGGKTWKVEMTASADVLQVELDGLNAVAVDTNDNFHYSKDGGVNWTMGAKGKAMASPGNLALHGTTVISAGTTEIYRSDDLGKTVTSQTIKVNNATTYWKDVDIATVKGATYAMLIGYAWDAVKTSVAYTSTDLGKKWTPLPSFPTNAGQPVRLSLGSDGKAFIVTGSALYRSPDKGVNWYSTSKPYQSYVLSLAYEAPGTILIGGAGSGYGSMLVSIDGGKTISVVQSTSIKWANGANAITLNSTGWAYLGWGYGSKGGLWKSPW